MLFRVLTYLSMLFLYIVTHIEVYLPTFGYILADSEIFRILAQLDMFMHVKSYQSPWLIQPYSEMLTD